MSIIVSIREGMHQVRDDIMNQLGSIVTVGSDPAFYGDVSSREEEEELIANAENYVELTEELKDQIGTSKYVERIERESGFGLS